MHQVRLAVFGSGAAQRPDPPADVDLVPSHPRCFLAALPCQGEHFYDPAERPAYLAGRDEDQCELVISQGAVSSNLLVGERNAVRRRAFEEPATNAPAKEEAQNLGKLVGGIGVPRRSTSPMSVTTSRL